MAGRKSKIIICGIAIFLCSLTRVMSSGTLDIDMNGQRAALKTGSTCPYPKTVKIRLNRGNETLETLSPLSLENGCVRFKNSKGDLEGSIIPCNQGNLPAFLLKLKNSGDIEALLRLEIALSVDSANDFTYWDGRKEHVSPKSKTFDGETDSLRDKFPLSCLWDKKSGAALGITPDTIASYLEFRFQPEEKELVMAFKPAIFPGKEETLGVVAFGFDAEFGKENALQAYYDSFSSVFAFNKDNDQRVYSSSAHCVAQFYSTMVPGDDIKGYYHVAPPKGQTGSPQEPLRRGYAGWEWVYSAYATAGDFYLSENVFNNYKPPKDKDSKPFMRNDFSYWKRWQKKNTSAGKPLNISMLYYVIDWVDKAYMEKCGYEDAIRFDALDVMNDELVHKNWVGPGVNSVRAFLWGNAYAEKFKGDVAKIFKELPVEGLSWDEADSFILYRVKEVLRNVPGCTWDERGVYAHQAVSQALFFDYVHSLKAQNFRPSIIGNVHSGGNYLVNFRLDGMIKEMTSGTILREKEFILKNRLFAGGKPVIQFGPFGRDNITNFMDFSGLTPKEMRSAYNDFSKYFTLFCTWQGIVIGFEAALGREYTLKHAPAIPVLSKAGWQPVPAAKSETSLWLSRFGKGEKAFVFAGNPEYGQKDFKLRLLNNMLDGEAKTFAPAEYYGAATESELAGKETAVSGKLPAYGFQILKILFGISPASTPRQPGNAASAPSVLPIVRGKASARCQTGNDKIIYSLSLRLDTEQDLRLSCEIPENFTLETLHVNGASVKAEKADGILSFLTPKAKNADITVAFASNVMRVPEKDVLEFPFLEQSKAVCSIVLPESPSEEETNIAKQIQEYFRYWLDREKGVKDVLIPIVNANTAAPTQNCIRVGRAAGDEAGPGVNLRLENSVKTLTVREAQAQSLQDACWLLLRTLDKKYQNIGRIQNYMPQSSPDTFESGSPLSTKTFFIESGLLGGTLYENE